MPVACNWQAGVSDGQAFAQIRKDAHRDVRGGNLLEASPTVSFSSVPSNSSTVSVKVTDDQGDYDTDSTTATINNVIPTADVGMLYLASVGETITLDASASHVDPRNDIISSLWDLDHDGQYDDASGVTVDYHATPESNDAVLAESTWSEGDYMAIAKDLTFVSVKKSTAASDEFFALELDPYADLE